MKYLFGPVPSRRLGRSLGIDLIPYKTCSFNCIFCECGATTDLTIKRQLFYPTSAVTAELTDFLKNSPELNYITFAGSGEPTLAKNIGEIICFLKKHYRYKIAVLTNGSLLSDPQVQQELLPAHLIIPSLHTTIENEFYKISRSAPGINLKQIIEGLIDFRKKYHGQYELEIFIVPGINDTESSLEALKNTVFAIAPDKIQLNSLDRPGSESWIKKPEPEILKQIAKKFAPIPVEIITKPVAAITPSRFDPKLKHGIQAMLERRPCTLSDIAESLHISEGEAKKYMNHLMKSHKIESIDQTRGTFYRIPSPQ